MRLVLEASAFIITGGYAATMTVLLLLGRWSDRLTEPLDHLPSFAVWGATSALAAELLSRGSSDVGNALLVGVCFGITGLAVLAVGRYSRTARGASAARLTAGALCALPLAVLLL